MEGVLRRHDPRRRGQGAHQAAGGSGPCLALAGPGRQSSGREGRHAQSRQVHGHGPTEAHRGHRRRDPGQAGAHRAIEDRHPGADPQRAGHALRGGWLRRGGLQRRGRPRGGRRARRDAARARLPERGQRQHRAGRRHPRTPMGIRQVGGNNAGRVYRRASEREPTSFTITTQCQESPQQERRD